MLLRLVSLLLLATALTAGCAHDPGPPADIEYHSSPIGGAQGKQPKGEKAKAKATRTREDSGPRRITVVATDSGLRFRAPAGWTVLTDGNVSFAANSPRAKEVAQQIGVTLAEFRARGLVAPERVGLRLTDPDALRALAAEED